MYFFNVSKSMCQNGFNPLGHPSQYLPHSRILKHVKTDNVEATDTTAHSVYSNTSGIRILFETYTSHIITLYYILLVTCAIYVLYKYIQ